jgi:cysteine desulfurase/selenocysteine lyase
MHYLDHATFSPPAHSTHQAILRSVTDLTGAAERDATGLALEWIGERERARAAVAALLRARASDVSVVESTTHGMGVVAGGLSLAPGDNVVFGDCDFIGLPTVWRTQQRTGVELRAVPSRRGRFHLDAIRDMVSSKTRVLAFSAVQEVSGVPLDVDAVAEIAASVGAFLVLDGIQEAGVIERHPDRHGVHAYASGGHKWLRSPYGAGFLWTAPSLRERLAPPFHGYFALCPPAGGWASHLADATTTSLEPLPFRDDGAALEIGGTPNWVGTLGIAEAVGDLLETGVGVVQSRARRLADALREELIARRVEPATEIGSRSTIVTFSLEPKVSDEQLRELAEAARVRVSVRGSAGVKGVRVSCHGHNTSDDVHALLEVVDRCLNPATGRRCPVPDPADRN